MAINKHINKKSTGRLPGKQRNIELNGGLPKDWVKTLPKAIKDDGTQKETAYFFAVVSTWQDADIIGANVRNLLAQGVSRVYILDNDSSDGSVEAAMSAGAHHAHVYSTKMYDDDLRCKLQNEIAAEITEQEFFDAGSNLWWIFLDADEFPAAPKGYRVLDYLETTNPSINLVGANAIDLYPTEPNQYINGEHPAKCMGQGVWRRGGISRYCECGHWKHPIVRYRNGKCDVLMSRGCHAPGIAPDSQTQLVEPDWDIVLFHAPIRREEETRSRLKQLCATRRAEWDNHVTRNNGAIKRFKSLDFIYTQQWHKVELPHTQLYGRPVTGITLYDWHVLAPNIKV